jgi:ankyrin repeat protein
MSRFRWAVCQLDSLINCLTRSQLRKSLAALPATLDETYDRILLAIDNDHSEYALRILQWLAFSARPLRVDEIAEVVAIDVTGNHGFDRDQILEDPLDVLKICSSLVTLATENGSDFEDDEADSVDDTTYSNNVTDAGKRGYSEATQKKVVFAHYSVKEYLISDRIQRNRAEQYSIQYAASNDLIARCCLIYLLQFQDPVLFSEETIRKSKLAQYSAKFWTHHAQAAGQETEVLNRLIMELFLLPGSAHLNSVRIHDVDFPSKGTGITRTINEVPSPLYYASLCGFTKIVELLINATGAEVNTHRGVCGSALQAASALGHDRIVELLLGHGADVNTQGGMYGSALQAASAGGHDWIAELLLGHGANANAQGGRYGSALQAASVGGHDRIVELLLGQGADVNVQSGYYGSALQEASVRGHDRIAELLLGHGADVNAQGGRYGSALQAASVGGHDRTVELLLGHGADVNVQGGYYGSALQAASAEGHDRIVELLQGSGRRPSTVARMVIAD